MIDDAHLKGLYKGTNLVAVAMDGNNQIVLIAFGICKGETGPCCSWWMSMLKECIGDNPNLLFISDRHAAMAMAVENEFPLAFHAVGQLGGRVGGEERGGERGGEELGGRRVGVGVREGGVEKRLSGLSCGHVIAITRFLGLTDCVQNVADWFKKLKYQGTYSESIHFLGNMQQWEFLQNIQKAIPPRMDNPQPGRPKNTNRIQSQGEEPRVIQCGRCKQAGHKRDQCSQPFVVQPPVNIRTQNDQEIP
ncbi:transposase, MuDR, MULE transposase domain protein [Tanacetum coccineum]